MSACAMIQQAGNVYNAHPFRAAQGPRILTVSDIRKRKTSLAAARRLHLSRFEESDLELLVGLRVE